MKIALITAVWKRPRLTRIVLSYLTRMTRFYPWVDVRRVAVYSDEDDWTQDEISDLGWHAVKFRNQPVSEKLNAGIREIDLRWDPDAVMVVDTDCLIPAEWLEWVGQRMAKGAQIAYLNGGAFLNLVDGHDEAGSALYTEPFQFGPGMTFDWELVQDVDLELWPGQHNQNLNNLALQNILLRPPVIDVAICEHPYQAGTVPMEVKVGDGIHSWENILQRVASARRQSFPWSGPEAYDLYDEESVESLWQLRHAPHKVDG